MTEIREMTSEDWDRSDMLILFVWECEVQLLIFSRRYLFLWFCGGKVRGFLCLKFRSVFLQSVFFVDIMCNLLFVKTKANKLNLWQSH